MNAVKEKVKEARPVQSVTRYRRDERIEYTLMLEDRDGRDSYSIRAVSFVRGVEICRATACDVSSLEDAALAMFTEIYSHFVDPFVLCDVVYDLLP